MAELLKEASAALLRNDADCLEGLLGRMLQLTAPPASEECADAYEIFSSQVRAAGHAAALCMHDAPVGFAYGGPSLREATWAR